MQILEDLYLDDVHSNERSFRRNSQYAKALDEVVKAGDALTDTLSEEQKKFYEERQRIMDDEKEAALHPDIVGKGQIM